MQLDWTWLISVIFVLCCSKVHYRNSREWSYCYSKLEIASILPQYHSRQPCSWSEYQTECILKCRACFCWFFVFEIWWHNFLITFSGTRENSHGSLSFCLGWWWSLWLCPWRPKGLPWWWSRLNHLCICREKRYPHWCEAKWRAQTTQGHCNWNTWTVPCDTLWQAHLLNDDIWLSLKWFAVDKLDPEIWV